MQEEIKRAVDIAYRAQGFAEKASPGRLYQARGRCSGYQRADFTP